MNYHINVLIIILMTLLLCSCHKDSETLLDVEINSKAVLLVETQFSGVVTDLEHNPISGAIVSIGNQTTISDDNGYFNFITLVNRDGAAVKISKDGYFDGIANMSLSTDSTNHVRISLVKKQLIQTITSSDAGTVEYQGHSVSFAPNSFKTQSDQKYQGEVEVYIDYIDPTTDRFAQIMPGNLLVDGSATGEILKSFGMLNVELYSPSGEALQIDEPATISMDIPQSLIDSAPDNLPLWYLDKNTATWVKEGIATKEGEKYTGTVEHFTLWNCDVPQGAIMLETTIISTVALKNVPVKISSESLGSTLIVYTNKEGKFKGLVPKNDKLTIRLLNNCRESVFQKELNTEESDLSEEFNLINTNGIHWTITGYATDCKGNRLSNAYILIKNEIGDRLSIFRADHNGYVNADYLSCNTSVVVSVINQDEGVQGEASFTFDNNQINIGNIEACGQEIASKIVYRYDEKVETYYIVTTEKNADDTKYTIYQSFSFDDGSSYDTSHELEYNRLLADQWEISQKFENIIGSPEFAYSFRIMGNLNFINQTDDLLEVEFPEVTLYDNVSGTQLSDNCKVYIKTVL